jgi:2-polyprenyl-3-methyl-5-hydroxy-6-metoxy-1,4-benzoquinol methylase
MTADLGGRCRRPQLVWDQRTVSWHESVSDTPGFVLVRDTLLRLADCALTDHCVDIGAGTGFVTLAMAAAGADVLAVDLSGAMLVHLEASSTAFVSFGLATARRSAAPMDATSTPWNA